MNDRDGSAAPSRILDRFEVLSPIDSAPARQKPKGKPTSASNRNSRNRFAAVNAFLDVSARTLPPSACLVWVLLWRDTKPEGLARTSQQDMAERLGLTVKTVKLALRTLRAAGLLEVVHRGRIGAGPSVYRLFSTREQTPKKGTK